jgi:hypothetical protein
MALYRSNGVPLLSRSDAPCAASFDSLDRMVKLNKFTRARLVAKNGTCLLKQIDVSTLSLSLFIYSQTTTSDCRNLNGALARSGMARKNKNGV